MPTFINTVDYPFELFILCFLWASQHLRELLRITMIVIILVTGYHLKQWLHQCNDKVKKLSTELARYKAKDLQKGEIIQHLAAENNQMRSKRPKVEAYMEETAHALLAIVCRGPSDESRKEGIAAAGTIPKADLLLSKDPEDRMCIICLADLRRNEMLIVLPRGHIFHPVCNERWMKQNFSCAHCQRELRWIMALKAANGSEMTWKYARTS